MGIPGFTTFLKENYNWKPVDFTKWKHVVIDGSNIFNPLYKENIPWAFGGEYDKFSAKIREFFELYNFNHPIVVFDGPHYDQMKRKTMNQRRKDALKEMHAVQKNSSWRTDGTRTGGITPLLLLSTAIETLRDMKVEFYIADGEADKEIAALANHHKCPVVGSDSDFFIFNLPHGFIHFNRLSEGLDSLYCSQELLKNRELCLLLPAFFGNDFFNVKTPHSVYDYSSFIDTIKKYESCEEYLSSSENEVKRERFNEMKKFYWELPLPHYYTTPPDEKLDECRYVSAGLPEWVYQSFKKGKFPKQLLNVYFYRESIAPRVVEAIEFESAWKISRYIRERLYHIMGIASDAEVKEVIRPPGTAELTETLVPAVSLKNPVTIKHRWFTDNNVEAMSDLVLALLKCHSMSREDIDSEFNALDSEWKLPIAATFYWYRSLCKTKPPSEASTMQRLVMSLIISFLVTSGSLPPLAEDHFSPVTGKTKSEHLEALHAFAQWQCVYCDAMALNHLAREPFTTTNPACLYSGSTAMYLALVSSKKANMVEGIFDKKPRERGLFNKFLYLVTGSDEGGRVGKHFIKLRGAHVRAAKDPSWTAVNKKHKTGDSRRK